MQQTSFLGLNSHYLLDLASLQQTCSITVIYDTFLKDFYTFYFRQCFAVPFKFSSVFPILFFSQFDGYFRSIKIKICRDFQFVFTSTIDMFSSCKDVQNVTEKRQKQGYKHGDILLHMANHLFFTVSISMNTATAFLSTLLVGSLTHYKHMPIIDFQIII